MMYLRLNTGCAQASHVSTLAAQALHETFSAAGAKIWRS